MHRQAAGSEVIKLATAIRQGVQPPSIRFEKSLLLDADIILCATNDYRRHYNGIIRYSRRFQSLLPIAGGRVVCLRNNYQRGLLNGVIYTVAKIAESADDYVGMILRDEDGIEYEALTPKICFGRPIDPNSIDRKFDPFDYGYALTVHKSQGSECRHVCVLDESGLSGFRYIAEKSGLPFGEFHRRWWYTGVTRASEHVNLMRL